jgi:hypothetical protein
MTQRGAVGGTSLVSGANALPPSDSAVGAAALRLWRQSQYPDPGAPAMLFQNGEDGFWYDPSDVSTMFQDAAGTIPVTGIGQPIGLLLDKSGNGYHASQSTDAARPTLEARKNELVATEAFDDAAWTATNMTVVGGATSPIGTSTAYTITATANNATVLQTQTVLLTRGIRLSMWVRRVTGTGNIQLTVDGTSFTTVTVSNDWERLSVVGNVQNGTRTPGIRVAVSGDAVEVWGAQWEFDAKETSNVAQLTAYQRVTTAADYEDIGLPRYVQFDGVDDVLDTATVANQLLTNKQRFSLHYAILPLNTSNGTYVAIRSGTSGTVNFSQASSSFRIVYPTNQLLDSQFARLFFGAWRIVAEVNLGRISSFVQNQLYRTTGAVPGYRVSATDNIRLSGNLSRMYEMVWHSAVAPQGVYDDIATYLQQKVSSV